MNNEFICTMNHNQNIVPYKVPANLFGVGTDAKTVKGEKKGYHTFIIYLSPERQNLLGKNICPNASEGCKKVCLFNAGRGKFTNVVKARMNKTHYFLQDREGFMMQAYNELVKGIKKYGADKICVRFNGTSDIPIENIPVMGFKNIIEALPDVQFYDYTKNANRFKKFGLPSNYHLTFSRSESNDVDVMKVLKAGYNVAIVFGTKDMEQLPKEYKGYKVINGDLSDLRFTDEKNVVVGLKFKGSKADMLRGIESGFVVPIS